MLGVSTAIWKNAEDGVPIRHGTAVLLHEKIPGLTYEWIYAGDTRGMDLTLQAKLGLMDGLERRNMKPSKPSPASIDQTDAGIGVVSTPNART